MPNSNVDTLNVPIDPIVPDLRHIVNSHIKHFVLQFNKNFLKKQIDEHKNKIAELQKELDLLNDYNDESSSSPSSAKLIDPSNPYYKYESDVYHSDNIEFCGAVSENAENDENIENENITLSIDELSHASKNSGSDDLYDATDENDNVVAKTSKYFSNKSPEKNNSIVADKKRTSLDFSQFALIKKDPSPEDDEDQEEEQGEDAQEDEDEEDEEEEQEQEQEDEEEQEEEEEEGVYEIDINGKSYFTTSEYNGVLYSMDEEGEPGDVVGKIVDGDPVFDNN
tara:strand:- start:9452 stop:10294 length:843 start_codon:yes stop_codon:yes gene_type:complete